MKVLVKQACEIQKTTMGPNIHKKPGTFNVPGSFLFDKYFIALLKDEKIIVQEMSEKDFEEAEKEAEVKKVDVDSLPKHVLEVLEKFGKLLSEKDKDGEDEKPVSTDSGDDASPDSQGSKSDEGEAGSESQVVSEGEKSDEVKEDADKKRFDELHEKAKRLNKKEKEEYDLLKKKLKIEE